ncbi:MAG: hypothetical protein WCP99_20685, partial [Burkholderiales bacterium]
MVIVLSKPELNIMKRAAIVSPLRTPVGAFGGSLKLVPVEELGAQGLDFHLHAQSDATGANRPPWPTIALLR